MDAVRYDEPGQHPLVEASEGGWRIATPDGWQNVQTGDWIITDSNGVSWAISNAMFLQLYERYDGSD